MKLVWPIQTERKFACVHLHTSGDSTLFYVLIVGVKAGELTVLDEFAASSAAALSDKIAKNIPVLLGVTGAKIISKKLGKSPNYLNEVLYNNPLQDFYLNEFDLGQQILVSLSRKDAIDFQLEALKAAGLEVIAFRIGPWVLKSLSDLMPDANLIPGLNYLYNSQSQELEKADESHDTLDKIAIGDQQISDTHTLAMALAINYLQVGDFSDNYEQQQLQAAEDFKYKQLFKKTGIAIVVFLLISLLLSYSLTGHYNSRQLELQAALTTHLQTRQQLEKSKEDLAYKTQVLGQFNQLDDQLISNYLWQIAASVPQQIQLAELTLFPLNGKVKNKEPILINKGQLVIKGRVGSTAEFAAWLEELRAKSWIKQAEVLEYQRVQRSNQFKLSLSI